MSEIEVPKYFLCPISLEMMKDPVTVSTSITYDRNNIERWIFSQGSTNCPVTCLPLSQSEDFVPNIVLRRLIQSWCTIHSVHRLPTPKPPVTKLELQKLLESARASPQEHFKCLEKLRSIASRNQTSRRAIETAGATVFLAALVDPDYSQQAGEEALTLLYNLRLSESGLRSLTNNAEFIESLTRTMQHGSYESRAYAVMLMESMMEVADPIQINGLKPEFFLELTRILTDQICQKASKATLKVLIRVCPLGKNRVKAVEAGAVPVLINLLLDSSDRRPCEMALMVLDYLCQCSEGRSELLNHGAGLAIVSKKIFRVSQVGSEKAVRILHSICRYSATPRVVSEMLQIGVVAKLCLVLQIDCGVKTKERAMEMLRLNARAWKNSACIPTSLLSSYPI